MVISAVAQPLRRQRHQVLLGAQGTKLPDDWELAVEAALAEPPAWVDSAHARQGAPARRRQRPLHRVLQEHLRQRPVAASGLKIVVDAAHGAAYHVAPDVFHELGAEVVCIGCAPDGLNINDGVGATAPAGAGRRRCKAHGADYGIALDGDADRLQMVDADGPPVQRRRAALRDGRRPPGAAASAVAGVVGTLMTNMAVELALRRAASSSCAPRSATATCSKSWSRAAWQLLGDRRVRCRSRGRRRGNRRAPAARAPASSAEATTSPISRHARPPNRSPPGAHTAALSHRHLSTNQTNSSDRSLRR